MKKLKALLGTGMALIMVMTSMLPISANTGTDYTSKTITMVQAEGKYKTQGRTGIVGTGLSMDWTGSGIEFNADCEGSISLNMKVQASWLHAYITAIIDGKRYSHIEAKTSSMDMEDVKLEIASNLAKGKHSICVYNETETPYAIMSVESLELSGQLTDPPKNNDLLIEFVGDSYLTGYGNIVSYDDDTVNLNDTPLVSDGAQSLGVLTANRLNADYSVLAASGYGLVCGFGTDTNVPKYYDYISWQRSHTTATEDQWSFSRQADIVVVELGDNDIGFSSTNGVTADSFKEGAKSFLQKIRSKNPNAKIVWTLYGWKQKIIDAVNELGGADAGLFTTTIYLAGSGGMGHPTVSELNKAADKFSSYLKNTIISPTTTTIPSATSTTSPSMTSTTADTSGTSSTASSVSTASSGTSAIVTVTTASPTANSTSTAIDTNSTTAPKTGDTTPYTIFWLIGINIFLLSFAFILCRKKESSKP